MTPPAPVRIVHLGLGNFFRAHQAWYTDACDSAREWGIAAFTGRSNPVAGILGAQDGLYTLVERSARGDRATIMCSISETNLGADIQRLVELLRSPRTAIVTLTITEAGYRLGEAGLPDRGDPVVVDDLAALRGLSSATPKVTSVLARLVVGLHARASAAAGPIAIVSCDNLPDNGMLTRTAVLALAEAVSLDLARWVADNVSFVSTSVDRITPRTQVSDRSVAAALTGWDDVAPVITEPFADWVLSGDFPAGRPRWEQAGARFVDDIRPFERRKLWLLNGAHSALAYMGILRGHRTVAEAVADGACREQIESLWDEAGRHLPTELLDLDEYRHALISRFENPRIEHRLEQIGEDGVAKLRARIVPVLIAERDGGRLGLAGTRAISSWVILQLKGGGLRDASQVGIDRALGSADPVRQLLATLDERLAGDELIVDTVRQTAADAKLI